MSDYIASRIEKPEFFTLSPLRRGRGSRKPYVIGFDSEADNGRPFLFQFSMPGQAEDDTHLIEIVDEPLAGLTMFMEFIIEHCTRKDVEYLIYGWNLAYEFTQLFRDLPDTAKGEGDLNVDVDCTSRSTGLTHHYEIHLFNDKRTLATFVNKRTKRMVRFLDGMSFYKTGLDNAAKMLKLGSKYEGVDRQKFTRASLTDEKFLAYARRDAFITRMVGEHIQGMHERYDVTTCISAPHFASKVFRRHFLTTTIEHPDPELEQLGLWSYHGGKNGFYLTEPTHVENAYQYDITSAYPEAMRSLPDVERGVWSQVRDYAPGRHAIYCATLVYNRCEYRGVLAHNGRWPESGYLEDICLTGYELDAMMEREECRIVTIRGWEFNGPTGGPLVRYVDEFFQLKATTEGAERETAKLFLNSLYGKFFQKVALGRVGWIDLDAGEWVTTDPDVEWDWRAGGLYHPPIASLITGYVRAKMHRMEHKYHSLMTSTDGIFGLVGPDMNDIGKTLGALTMARGDLKIWRERLYIFRAPDDKPKMAFHGFRGDMTALDAIPLARGTYRYTAQQMITLKMSRNRVGGRRYEPGQFATLPFEIVI